MLNELLTLNIFAFFLIFSRVGTALMILPGFSAQYVSTRIRLAFALAVCLALLPFLLKIMPEIPGSASAIILLIVTEALIGIFIGTIARIAISALQTAGTLIAMFASLANALTQDELTEQQSSIISGFLTIVGMTLVFATNLHHLMLEALIDTYSIFAPGVIENLGDFAQIIGRSVAKSFSLGLKLASPFLIVALVYYVGLGLAGRLMPALPLFFFMMPIQITVQFTVLMAILSSVMLVFLQNFEESILLFAGP